MRIWRTGGHMEEKSENFIFIFPTHRDVKLLYEGPQQLQQTQIKVGPLRSAHLLMLSAHRTLPINHSLWYSSACWLYGMPKSRYQKRTWQLLRELWFVYCLVGALDIKSKSLFNRFLVNVAVVTTWITIWYWYVSYRIRLDKLLSTWNCGISSKSIK